MMANQIQVGGRALTGARQIALRIDGAELCLAVANQTRMTRETREMPEH
jgi:hypothetical protein